MHAYELQQFQSVVLQQDGAEEMPASLQESFAGAWPFARSCWAAGCSGVMQVVSPCSLLLYVEGRVIFFWQYVARTLVWVYMTVYHMHTKALVC